MAALHMNKPISCALPHLDPTTRMMMPMGLFGLIGFGLFFVAFCMFGFLANLHKLNTYQQGMAVVIEEKIPGMEAFPQYSQTIKCLQVLPWQHVEDSVPHAETTASRPAQANTEPPGTAGNSGATSAALYSRCGSVAKPSTLVVDLPSGAKSAAVGTQEPVRFKGRDVELVSTLHSNLLTSGAMALFGLLPWAVAYVSVRHLRQDQARLAALKNARRIPASALRLADERIKRRQRFRVYAEFEHLGRRFEAPSELFDFLPELPADPSALHVALHPADVRLSMLLFDAKRDSKRV
jgi:hypothetical protein